MPASRRREKTVRTDALTAPTNPRRIQLARLLADLAVLTAMTAPVFTILSRGISPVMLAISFTALLLSAIVGHRLGRAWAAFWSLMLRPAGLVGLALMALMIASIAWSPAPLRGAELGMQSIIAVLGIAGVVAGLLVRPDPPRPTGLAVPTLLALAAVLLLVETTLGSPLRTAVGANPDPSRLNRAAVSIALFLPVAAPALWVRGWWPAALALAVLVAAATFSSISESAKLALLVMAAVLVLQALSERVARLAVGAGMIVSLLAIPWVAPYINPLIPQAIHEEVGRNTLFARGEIWAANAALVPHAPLFGHGLEAGHVAGETLGQLVPDAMRNGLGWGHPHNAPLQVWVELGAAGVMLVLLLQVLLTRGLSHLPPPFGRAATLLMAGVWSITFVSHGAWQAWWWALIGMAVIVLVSEARAAQVAHTPAGSKAASR